MESDLKVESSEVPYGRTLFNDGEAIEGYSFGDDRGFEMPTGTSTQREPTSANQFSATPNYGFDTYGVDMTGNYVNQNGLGRAKPEQTYGQQAGTDQNQGSRADHAFYGIP